MSTNGQKFARKAAIWDGRNFPRRTRRRKRRFNPWRGLRWSYKRANRLHEHEELAILALLVERGPSSSGEWDSREPGRWNERMLNGVFRRLRRKQHVKRAGIATPSIFGAGRRCRYAITELGRKRLEVERHEQRERTGPH